MVVGRDIRPGTMWRLTAGGRKDTNWVAVICELGEGVRGE